MKTNNISSKLKKLLVALLIIVPLLKTNATNYYVSQLSGSETNNGLSTNSPFLRLQQSESFTQPGDTVFVMNGTYTNDYQNGDVLTIFKSGTSNAWITYKNYPNHSPIVKLKSNNWQGINIQGAKYIIIDGFIVIGSNDDMTLAQAQALQSNLDNPATSGNGIAISKQFSNPSNRPHHIIVRNCKVSKCGGGGIVAGQADYITIENNVISECAWYSPYDSSGISLYQNWNSDNEIKIRNFITGNICYRNQNYIPFFVTGTITDGNGIIIDDFRNTQFNSTVGEYLGQTYIANNLIFDNGARGIHCYFSDNVIVVNNTCYKNCQSSLIKDGEFTAFDSKNIKFINNIAYPDENVPPIKSYFASNLVVDYNLWAYNSSLADPIGNNFITLSPDFISPSTNPLEANFRILPTSAARNSGTSNFAPLTDFDGNARPSGGAYDIGAYEFVATANTVSVTSVSLNPVSATILVNGAQQLNATVAPTNATNQNVSWTSSNAAVASVNNSGLVTGIAAGNATITATTQDGNKTATSQITVSQLSSNSTEIVSAPSAINQNSTNELKISYSAAQAGKIWAGLFDSSWNYVGGGSDYVVNANTSGTVSINATVTNVPVGTGYKWYVELADSNDATIDGTAKIQENVTVTGVTTPTFSNSTEIVSAPSTINQNSTNELRITYSAAQAGRIWAGLFDSSWNYIGGGSDYVVNANTSGTVSINATVTNVPVGTGYKWYIELANSNDATIDGTAKVQENVTITGVTTPSSLLINSGFEDGLSSGWTSDWSGNSKIINQLKNSDYNDNFKVNVYPNPVVSNLNLTYNLKTEGNVTFQLHNSYGNQIKQFASKAKVAGEQTFNMDVSDLKTGIYFIKITTSDGEQVIKKILVNNN